MTREQGYDVFISYAHADNEVPVHAGISTGWVGALAANLNVGPNVLKKQIFIDYQLKPGDEFNDALISKVRNSKLLIIFLSQNYATSQWCGKELSHFIQAHSVNSEKPADVFVVELFPYEQLAELPDNIHNIRKHFIHAKFWAQPFNSAFPILSGYPTPHDNTDDVRRHYWINLNNLQKAIDVRLREEIGLSKNSIASISSDADKKTTNSCAVLLADVTEDLEPKRNEIKQALEAEKFQVLPEGDYIGLSNEEFDQAFAQDLEQSELFVQLLSPTVGRKGKGYPAPLPQLQFQHAQKVKKSTLQWCEQSPLPNLIADTGHAKLFETEFLRVTNLNNFKDEIIEYLMAQRRKHNKACVTSNHSIDTKELLDPDLLPAPYVGLRPFEEIDARLFFGREAHVHDLLSKLEHHQRFIAVIGASGSGKSSLVRAGLIPALHRGALASADYRWRVCITKPGDAPLQHLVEKLTEDHRWIDGGNRATSIASLRAQFAVNPLSLIEQYQRRANLFKGEALLLVIDQFEEIFRYRQQNIDEAEAFVKLLLRSVSEPEPVPIYVVITLRSDFIGNCAAFFGLPETINNGLYLIPRLRPEQLKSIIAVPLALFNGDIDPVLVNRLVNVLEGNDELPILEHALLQMWNQAYNQGRSRIETQDFALICNPSDAEKPDAQPKLVYAIDNHASEIYQQLTATQQAIAQQVFPALVERRENRKLRRPRTFQQLVDLVGVSHQNDLLAVMNAYREQGVGFLLPPLAKAITPETLIDISHESLFRQWQQYRQWLDAEALDAAELLEWHTRLVRHQQTGASWLDEIDFHRAVQWLRRIERYHNVAQWAARYLDHHDFQTIEIFIQASQQQIQERQQAENKRLETETALLRQLTKAHADTLIVTAENLFNSNRDQSVLLGLLARFISSTPKVEAYLRYALNNLYYHHSLRGRSCKTLVDAINVRIHAN